ncbi:hypothetical protein AMELA_G00152440 [Ameiurus melas]|uniref:Uncharacterized protein n=1 Tax=Ameiurus melas TaxID=219545 RepID=A0A7J6AIM8_AMEME|nr:hypothetical protein AMELA_G00152440 [Ameiurus melas]
MDSAQELYSTLFSSVMDLLACLRSSLMKSMLVNILYYSLFYLQNSLVQALGSTDRYIFSGATEKFTKRFKKKSVWLIWKGT